MARQKTGKDLYEEFVANYKSEGDEELKPWAALDQWEKDEWEGFARDTTTFQENHAEGG